MDKNIGIIAIANIVMIIFTPGMFIFAVYSFKRTLKESWRNSVLIAATDYIGELEKLRLRKLDSQNNDSDQYGNIISLQKRLEILLFKKKKYNNIINIAEDLRNRADKSELYTNEYRKKEKDFFEMVYSILQ